MLDFQGELKNLETTENSLSRSVGQLEGQKSLLATQIANNQEKIVTLETLRVNTTKAIELLHLVQRSTRDKICAAFENTVTFALRSIYNQDYRFKLEFTQRGNLGELHFKLKSPENADYLDLEDATAGGSLDVISLALRFALIQILKCPGFIVLDEATKMLSRNYRTAEFNFYKQMSEKLNRQLLIITHSAELIEMADTKIQIGA